MDYDFNAHIIFTQFSNKFKILILIKIKKVDKKGFFFFFLISRLCICDCLLNLSRKHTNTHKTEILRCHQKYKQMEGPFDLFSFLVDFLMKVLFIMLNFLISFPFYSTLFNYNFS